MSASDGGIDVKTRRKDSRRPSRKINEGKLCGNETWTVVSGKLTNPPGRPGPTKSLFRLVGEKIPFEFLDQISKSVTEANNGVKPNGVYIAHDSMGCARYIGRGAIFDRLKVRRDAQILELVYFSFFVVEQKMHEREIETIMIRSAGPQLYFNDRKVRNDIQAGSVRDFEPGTQYIERQYKKGPAHSA